MRFARSLFGLLCCFCVMFCSASCHAQTENNRTDVAEKPTNSNAPTPIDRFVAAQRAADQYSAVMGLLAQGKLAEATALLEGMSKTWPFLAEVQYNLGCLYATQGEADKAFERLKKAVEFGFRDVDHIQRDTDLEKIRSDKRFGELIDLAKEVSSKIEEAKPNSVASIKDQQVTIGVDSLTFDTRTQLVRSHVAWSEKDPLRTAPDFLKGSSEEAKLLRKWLEEKSAAGNYGDLYDCCDRDHSRFPHENFPSLTRIQYAKEIAEKVPYGLQNMLWHDGVVVGNSSTAYTAQPLWRSNARVAYISQRDVSTLYFHYTNNQTYLYPEHRDHDPGKNGKGNDADGGYGDVYPANTPYLLTSQGSSGSDQPFLHALFCTLASFRPEVKKKLVEERVIAPTLQYIFRSSLKNVPNDEAYLSGVAHPSVFNSSQLDVLRMMNKAHDMTLDKLPPIAEFQILTEEQGRFGIDYFDIGPRTQIFTTPAAAARIYRTMEPTLKVVVSAERSRSLAGANLEYRWVLLSGNSDLAEVRKLNDNGSRAELVVPYTPRHETYPGSGIESNRIEFGLFVKSNGVWSAPAFLTYWTLDNEVRTYDDFGRIQKTEYHGGSDEGNYADVLLDAPKTWTDEYRYSNHGKPLGWTRVEGEKKTEFNERGEVVLKRNEAGEPIETAPVRYFAVPRTQRPLVRTEFEVLPNSAAGK